MIIKEIVVQHLSPIIENVFGFIPQDQFGFVETIVLAEYENGEKQTIPVDSFVSLFAEAEDMTKEALLIVDGGTKGYEPFITEWHQNGLIGEFIGDQPTGPIAPAEEVAELGVD